MAKASINFQKTKHNSVAETTREFEAHYLLPKEHRLENEYWNCGKSDSQIFQDELAKASRKGGRVPKEENSLWEAVINLNKEHRLEDVQRVAKHIEEKFNITCSRIALHKDEGHINERGIVEYNLHAHINFVTYKDGKQNWRREHITPQNLSQLQTDIAKELNMTRGKEGSEAVRLGHKQHRVIAKEREAKEDKIFSLKTENEALKYDFREFQKRITGLENQSIEDKKELHRLNTQVKKGEATIQELEKRLSEALQSKNTPETIKDTPKEEKNDFRASEGHYLRETMTLRREIKQIKEEHSKLKEEHSKLKMAYDSLCQHLQEITGYRVLVKAVEAIKAKFLPTQEAKREEKPNVFQTIQTEADARLKEQKPLKGKELMDEVQRLNEQGKKNIEYAKEQSKEPEKPKSRSFGRDR